MINNIPLLKLKYMVFSSDLFPPIPTYPFCSLLRRTPKPPLSTVRTPPPMNTMFISYSALTSLEAWLRSRSSRLAKPSTKKTKIESQDLKRKSKSSSSDQSAFLVTRRNFLFRPAPQLNITAHRFLLHLEEN
jgi:hypothetical protein